MINKIPNLVLPLFILSLPTNLCSKQGKIIKKHPNPERFQFERSSKSIVVIKVVGDEGNLVQGSGVVLDKNIVATNYHVIKGSVSIAVSKDGIDCFVSKIKADPVLDIALLETSGLNLPSSIQGMAKNSNIGDKVFTIGAPKGLEASLSDGIVSSKRLISGIEYLQITAPISPGSSGGGVYDQFGRLIGITTFKISGGENLNFAIPLELVRQVLRDYSWQDLIDNSHNTKSESSVTQIDYVKELLKMGSIDQALTIIEKLNKEHPLDHEIKELLVNCLLEKGVTAAKSGEMKLALELNQRVIGLAPSNSFAWEQIGIIRASQSQYFEASTALEEAFRLNPKSSRALHALGICKVIQGQKQEAHEIYKKLCDIDFPEALKFYEKYLNPHRR